MDPEKRLLPKGYFKHAEKAISILLDINDIIRRIEAAIRIQEFYFKSREHYHNDINGEELTEIIWDSIIMSLFKYMELYEKFNSSLKAATSNNLARFFYKHLKDDGIRDLRHESAHTFRYDGNNQPTEDDMNENYIENLEQRHKSLLAFYMKVHSYPYIEDKCILDILKQLKSDLFDYIKQGVQIK